MRKVGSVGEGLLVLNHDLQRLIRWTFGKILIIHQLSAVRTIKEESRDRGAVWRASIGSRYCNIER
jgi:hypothetical protein